MRLYFAEHAVLIDTAGRDLTQPSADIDAAWLGSPAWPAA